MPRRITIFDTSLRHGELSPGSAPGHARQASVATTSVLATGRAA